MSEFEGLYAPIAGATETYESERPVVETPRDQMERTMKLKEQYGDLRTDLLDEINLIDARIIRPAIEAQDFIQPIKKTIKKRENKKLDFERYQDRVGSLQRKLRRSDRENANLAKAEIDLGRAREVCMLDPQSTLHRIIAKFYNYRNSLSQTNTSKRLSLLWLQPYFRYCHSSLAEL